MTHSSKTFRLKNMTITAGDQVVVQLGDEISEKEPEELEVDDRPSGTDKIPDYVTQKLPKTKKKLQPLKLQEYEAKARVILKGADMASSPVFQSGWSPQYAQVGLTLVFETTGPIDVDFYNFIQKHFSGVGEVLELTLKKP
jgi:hypothetical protein